MPAAGRMGSIISTISAVITVVGLYVGLTPHGVWPGSWADIWINQAAVHSSTPLAKGPKQAIVWPTAAAFVLGCGVK